MSSLWNGVIGASNPRWENASTHHYGDPRAEAQAADADVISALTHVGAIAVRGRDAERLLQGQLTSDVDLLTSTRTLPGAWCSPKGRVLTLLRLVRHGEAVLLQLPREYVGSTIARMGMYVLRADAVLEDASEQMLTVGLSGPGAAARLAAALGEAPRGVDEAVNGDGCIAVRLPGAGPRFAVLAAPPRLRALWRQWAAETRPVGSNAWRLGDIRAGFAELSGPLADAFLPQMLNLQALGAVSFTKGCYTGQEVVARTQHLGRLKRRLYLAVAAAGDPPRPGDALYATEADRGAAIGTVVSAAANASGQWELLAVIRIDAAEGGEIRLDGESGGRKLALRPLPYSLDAR